MIDCQNNPKNVFLTNLLDNDYLRSTKVVSLKNVFESKFVGISMWYEWVYFEYV